jgi:predicted acylesterase/phospholipase RssA
MLHDDDVPLRRGKTALVLAGGGVTGAVYEIGALCALDDALLNFSVSDFDIYVGTSAGALVAACLANGLTPHELMQHIETPIDGVTPLRLSDVLALDRAGLLRRVVQLPGALARAAAGLLVGGEHISLLDAIEALATALPSGLYDIGALERYLNAIFSGPGRSNDFQALRRELAIIATDLDTGDRAVFGLDPFADVPIARAVAASAALPLVYRPVQIGGRDYVDGGVRGTASLDLAIERGAKLIVCVNPQVPLDSRRAGGGDGHIRQLGAPGIVNQVFRTFIHAGLHYHLKQIKRTHREVDIILIEPARDDQLMFSETPMRYATRLAIARHGFETVARRLSGDPHDRLRLERHGIRLGKRLAADDSGLTARSTSRLHATLAELDHVLSET